MELWPDKNLQEKIIRVKNYITSVSYRASCISDTGWPPKNFRIPGNKTESELQEILHTSVEKQALKQYAKNIQKEIQQQGCHKVKFNGTIDLDDIP